MKKINTKPYSKPSTSSTGQDSPLAEVLQRMLGFAGVGLIGTGCHYLVLIVGVSILRRDPVVASVFGALFGALVNYLLNYYLNYRSRRSHKDAGPRFFLVAGGGFAINWYLMKLLVHQWSWPYLAAQLTVTAIVFFWNFTANHLWTFRRTED